MGDPTRRAMMTGLASALAAPAAARLAAAGALDGSDFAGVLTPLDGGRAFDDTLHFREGFYWSKGCIACSFAPGAYWTRRVDGDVAFTGVLQSPERGRFDYEGLIEGDTIDVAVHWRRERWYWTTERVFRFTGTRIETGPETNLEAAFERAGRPRAPGCTL